MRHSSVSALSKSRATLVWMALLGAIHEVAGQLARLLNQAESKLSADRLALFSTFEGVVHMDVQSGRGHVPIEVQEESK
jgi:hypothetical protein